MKIGKGLIAGGAIMMYATSGIAQTASTTPVSNVVQPSMKVVNMRQGGRIGAERKDENNLAPLAIGLLAIVAAGAAAGVAVAVSNDDSPASP